MNNFIIYSVETAISLALFYSAYWLFLKNETFFKLNRLYLAASVGISLLMPLLNITLVSGEHSFLARYLLLPVEQYEQRITRATVHRHLTTKYFHMNHGRFEQQAAEAPAEALLEDRTATDPVQTLPLSSPESNTGNNEKTNWLTIISVIYLTGAALFFLRFTGNFILLYHYASKNKSQLIAGRKVIRLNKSLSPFSFWNLIFIGRKDYPEAELSKIISHETIHIRQKHTIDLVLFELLLVFQWFNPFVWLYRRAINITHEYLADQGALNSGVDLSAYQYALLNEALGGNNFEIASNYNLSIKKRITMMKKKRSSKLATLKLGIALPILIFLFSAFAFNTSASTIAPAPGVNEAVKPVTLKDTAIKRVNVSADYLRLLEGEYISTNEPGRVRKIRFAVVMGELIGNDLGYIYRLIPVGGETFINPDDHAALIFDTRDKNAITLSLFGKINLKKVKPTRKPGAFEMVNVITKDGIPAALAYYKSYKDSSNYIFGEGEMNYAGYMLLNAGKAKEAATLFKLNVENFPNSFNVYDSYGEALLAMGDKSAAIENYKKSVRLNPGNASGLKVLREAGINTDDLIKKVPLEYLKQLEGEYVSTNEPGRVRRITFKVVDGVLTGNDNGYQYRIFPVDDGKFINPDDGASLVFDTKDKNAISLLLFGWVRLKKITDTTKEPEAPKVEPIKKADVPVSYLKLLAGQYVSTNQPKKIRRIVFEVIDGELVGDDNGYVYKIIPVGGEKFINPDDGASLVFDSKDKNAITLLLFGKINLKKIN